MKLVERFLASLLAVLLLLAGTPGVSAAEEDDLLLEQSGYLGSAQIMEETPTDAPLEEPPPPASEMLVDRVYLDLITQYYLRVGESADTLPLMEFAAAYYSWTYIDLFEIAWRYGEFDNTTPGRRLIVGDIILPSGFAFKAEPLTVTSPVIVYDDSGAPFIKLKDFFYTNTWEPLVLPQGISREEMANFFADATCYKNGLVSCHTEYGDTFETRFTLDLDLVDTDVPGVYYPVSADLPPGITFGGQEFWIAAVHVLPTDRVVLDAVGRGNNRYVVQWVYPATNTELWMSVDNSDWKKVEEYTDFGEFLSMEDGSVSGFTIPYHMLQPGKVYRYQVKYDGGQCSDILVLDFTNSNVPKASIDAGGDRDDDNRGEQGAPPNIGVIPPPNIPNDNGGSSGSGGQLPATSGNTNGNSFNQQGKSSEAVKPSETTVESSFAQIPGSVPMLHTPSLSLTASGLSALLQAYPQGLTVTEHEVKAVFPAQLLEGIVLQEGEELAILLERPAADSFLVRLQAGDHEIAGFNGETFFVHLAYDAPEESLSYIYCVDASGVAYPAARFEDGRFVFELPATGEYRITNDTPPEAVEAASSAPTPVDTEEPAEPVIKEMPKKPSFPFIPVAACGLLAVVTGAAVLYRRRTGRRGL